MPALGGLEARARKRVGTTLRGKYRLDSLLGVGGMASVYAATHRNKKRFAVKVLHTELSMSDDVRARFLREGYAANTVGHPGAVAVLDDDVAEDGAAFLVMDLFDGHTVDVVWECHQRRMTCGVVLCAARQILEILAVAHRQHVVHRDIKPANLFITRDGDVKILDFGIARLRDAPGATTTRAGVVLGTPAFMSPEQAMAKPEELDGASDVWAVGATMFTLLSGQHVHDGESSHQVLIHAATRAARSLASVEPDLPAEVVALVDKALAFEKGERWPSAAAMGEAVEAVHLALSGEPTSRAALASAIVSTEARLKEQGAFGSLSPVATTSAASQDRSPSRDRSPPGTTARPLVFKQRAAQLARSSRARKVAAAILAALAASALIVGARSGPSAEDEESTAAGGGAMPLTHAPLPATSTPVATEPPPAPIERAPVPAPVPAIAAPAAVAVPSVARAAPVAAPRAKSADAGSPAPTDTPRRDPLAP